jgi:hypothetical protein
LSGSAKHQLIRHLQYHPRSQHATHLIERYSASAPARRCRYSGISEASTQRSWDTTHLTRLLPDAGGIDTGMIGRYVVGSESENARSSCCNSSDQSRHRQPVALHRAHTDGTWLVTLYGNGNGNGPWDWEKYPRQSLVPIDAATNGSKSICRRNRFVARSLGSSRNTQRFPITAAHSRQQTTLLAFFSSLCSKSA